MTALAPALPLAPGQELLWEFLTALSPGNPALIPEVAAAVWSVTGEFDEAPLRAALTEVVRRQEALRLAFLPPTGPDWSGPARLTVQPDTAVPLAVTDLTDLAPDAREAELAALIAADRVATFDLTRAPLWRCRLVRLAPDRHALSAVFSHLIADGWACRVFIEDVVRAYRIGTGRDSDPGEPPLSFTAAGDVQRREMSDPAARARYWREQLRPLPEYLPFPVRPTTAATDLAAETAYPFRFAPEVHAGLRRVAWRARTTPYVVLFAAQHLLLARRTGARRVVVGTTVLGRHSAAVKRTFGQFTTNVFVPAEVDADDRLIEVVRRVHGAMQAATDNVLPYTQIAAAANAGFARARPWPDNHLFHAYLQADKPGQPPLEFPELTVRRLTVGGRGTAATGPALPTSAVPAGSLPVWRKRGQPYILIDDDRGGGRVIVNPTFYDADLVRALIRDYVSIVDVLVTDPQLRVRELAV